MAEGEQEKVRLVLIGASAGGVEAISAIVGSLPEDFAAAVCIVLHMSARGPNLLSSIIARRTRIPTKLAEQGDLVQSGKIYVAPANHHLLFHDGHLRLSSGPRQNRHRPSIDALFRSGAEAYGSRVIGCILTGYLDDGTAGLQAIKNAGGIAVVQDPADALVPGMPESARRHVEVDYLAPLAEIPALLEQLLKTEPKEITAMADKIHHEDWSEGRR